LADVAAARTFGGGRRGFPGLGDPIHTPVNLDRFK
jgi:hypothetical protein